MRERRTRKRRFRGVLAPAAAVLAIIAGATAANAAPAAELWERWLPHDAESGVVVDHSAWDRILERYIAVGPDRINRFDYGAVTRRDRAALLGYLDTLARVPIAAYRRAEQAAYWINLYNALTVRVVLDHYPVASIRDIDISPGLFSDGPWRRKLVTIDGTAVSLDDIEHRILRPIWRDPRVHYVLTCAALGCPQLNRRAFTAHNVERLMNESARAYINHPRGVSVTGRGIELSHIYRWYAEDFGADQAALFAHLRAYADARLADILEEVPRIRGYHYDWSLNDALGSEDRSGTGRDARHRAASFLSPPAARTKGTGVAGA